MAAGEVLVYYSKGGSLYICFYSGSFWFTVYWG